MTIEDATDIAHAKAPRSFNASRRTWACAPNTTSFSRHAARLPHRRDPRAQRQVLSRRAREGRARRAIPSDSSPTSPDAPQYHALPADPRLAAVHRAVRQAVRLVPDSAAASRTRRSASAPTSSPGRLKLSTDLFGAFDRTPRLKIAARVRGVRRVVHHRRRRRRAEPAGPPADRHRQHRRARSSSTSLRFGRDYFLGGTLYFTTRISRR